MIKIIKFGTRQIRTCSECGCQFSFEKEDITREDTDNYKGYREFVQCPQCHQKIILQATR